MQSLDCNRAETLASLLAEPEYSARVIAIAQRIPLASEPVDVLELLYEAAEALGANHAGFVSYIRDDMSYESFRFVLACDPRWCFEYQAMASYAHDPWLMHASVSSEPVCASQIKPRTKTQQAILDLAVRYGIASACIAPAPSASPLRRVGVLGIGARTKGFFEAEGFAQFAVLARCLAMEMNAWWVRRIRKELIESCGITDEDLVLLSLERDGLGTKQVAHQLGTTTASVDSRWQRLNRKLQKANRQASAAFAAEHGLV